MGIEYVYDYEICSFFFLLVTTVFFFLQRRLPGRMNSAFGLMLVMVLLSQALNTATYFADNNAAALPLLFLYALNILSLSTTNCALAMFFYYTYLLTNKNQSPDIRVIVLSMLPVVLLVAAIVTTPLTDWIFYFGDGNKYLQGSHHYLLFISAGFYVVATACQVFLSRRIVGRRILTPIYIMAALMLAAIVVQYLYPSYMVTGTAGALAMVVIYNALQSPNDFLDATTGIFNRSALPQLTESLYSRGQEFSALLWLFRDLSSVSALYGAGSGDQAIASFIDYVRKTFPRSYLVRLESDRFACLLPHTHMDEAKLQEIAAGLPTHWQVDGQSVALSILLVGMSSVDHHDLTEASHSLGHVMNMLEDSNKQGAIFIDDRLAEEARESMRVERLLRQKLAAGHMDICFQPIFSLSGHCYVAAEALARLHDENNECILPAAFIPIAERTGLIDRLCELVLDQVCDFIAQQPLAAKQLRHISVNLSPRQCRDAALADKLIAILDRYQVPASLLCFEITESAASLSVGNLSSMMQELNARGASFALDDFGIGYANLDSLITLPFRYAKIDKSLLWSADSDKRKEPLLKNIINIFSSMGLSIICEGAETREQVELLYLNNVDMIQGFYYSRPITAGEFAALLASQEPQGQA